MTEMLTFVDACLLLAAARGIDDLSDRAIAVLDDTNRRFVTSDFLALEILPKAVYNQMHAEASFYRGFLESAEVVVHSSHELVVKAQSEAERLGLSAIDALHVVAAREAGCDEFITAEKATKPLFRVQGLAMTTIRD